ncbi:baseplate J/gp47 family protein [Clostridiaceae bacterium NSJ-31]|uniref:Baseplate J/gp47 family protein n=1 Tax=Ligaoa zhengdingensis TaxID=2763658 RepID=A0A926DWA5_9FIRM|nr:baseplate J/gp47 family protein [Ligaoa zhengdingensis]MBC8546445.1 baseplate J/gp47 family protein [Ligaoa zhengdingensis]
MAENYEYKEILSEMLAEVPDDLDKREGSIIYNTLAPAAVLIAQQNYQLGYLFNLLFADTATDIWLDRVVNDFGVTREAASNAIRQINLYDADGTPMDAALGARFMVEDITLKLTEKLETGKYKAEVEQTGTTGNLYGGDILPTDNINGLGRAELVAQPLIPARDEETDDELRERFYSAIRRAPFGGNIADYEEKTLSIDGVGAVQVFSAVTEGVGNVGLVIGDEQGNTATEELVEEVQSLMGSDGTGIAPIFHTVTVKTSTNLPVNVTASVKLKTGTSFSVVKPVVEGAIQDYIEGVGFSDETVFHAKLVSDILNSHESIVDVGAVTINGSAGNLALSKTFASFQVPVVGAVAVSEVTS